MYTYIFLQIPYIYKDTRLQYVKRATEMFVSPSYHSFSLPVVYSAVYYICTEGRPMETGLGDYHSGSVLMK